MTRNVFSPYVYLFAYALVGGSSLNEALAFRVNLWAYFQSQVRLLGNSSHLDGTGERSGLQIGRAGTD